MILYAARPKVNAIYTPVFDEAGATEPVTLAELKAHLVITYSDDDTYLTFLISACRHAVEQFCNISIVQKECTIMVDAYCEIELPYGPVQSFTSATLKTGNGGSEVQVLNDGYQIDGPTESFQRFIPLSGGRYTLVYDTGYAIIPQDLKLDLVRICGYCYQNKGDQPLTSLQSGLDRPKGLDQALELFAAKHRRLWV
jgi:uncharacterized phiE125 gp8 family phage protein